MHSSKDTPSVTNTFTYDGQSPRVGKTDSTGTYTSLCDGTAPGSPILSDGAAVYTPGLSERRGMVTPLPKAPPSGFEPERTE